MKPTSSRSKHGLKRHYVSMCKPFSYITPLHYMTLQKQSSGALCKKGVPKNFTKFTGKHLCQSLLFDKVAGLSYRTPPMAASDSCCVTSIIEDLFS